MSQFNSTEEREARRFVHSKFPNCHIDMMMANPKFLLFKDKYNPELLGQGYTLGEMFLSAKRYIETTPLIYVFDVKTDPSVWQN